MAPIGGSSIIAAAAMTATRAYAQTSGGPGLPPGLPSENFSFPLVGLSSANAIQNGSSDLWSTSQPISALEQELQETMSDLKDKVEQLRKCAQYRNCTVTTGTTITDTTTTNTGTNKLPGEVASQAAQASPALEAVIPLVAGAPRPSLVATVAAVLGSAANA